MVRSLHGNAAAAAAAAMVAMAAAAGCSRGLVARRLWEKIRHPFLVKGEKRFGSSKVKAGTKRRKPEG